METDFPMSRRIRHPSCTPLRRASALLALVIVSTSGCRSGGVGPLERWRMAFDESVARPPTDSEAGPRQGLLSRYLNQRAPKTSEFANNGSTLVLGSDGWS